MQGHSLKDGQNNKANQQRRVNIQTYTVLFANYETMKVSQFPFRASHPQGQYQLSQNNFRISYKHLHNIQKLTIKQ